MAELLTKGATLKIDDTLVKGVKSMGEITETTSKIEVTTLADEGKRYINGIKEYGDEISFACNYEKAEFLRLRGLADGESHSVEIAYSDNLKITFEAYVSVGLSGVEVDAVHEMTVGLTPASAIAIADGAAA